MITESYVSFETARMLKKAGFDELCDTFYSSNVGAPYLLRSHNSELDKKHYSRPTQALAARWLREAHGIYVMLTPCYSLAPSDNLDWVVDLFNLKKAEYIQIRNDRKVVLHIYEEAFEYGIQQALKLII